MNENIAFSKRNVEFIIMAIISAFFVALGSNIGKLFINWAKKLRERSYLYF